MAKYKTKEEAVAALTSTKEEKKVAFDELRAFEKENKLAKGEDHSADAKLGKKWSKLKEMHTKKKTAVEAIETAIAEFKAANKATRTTTYDYPKVDGKEMTAAEKKKYRAKQRAAKKSEAKKADKAEEKATDKKSGKKSKKDKKTDKATETSTEEAGEPSKED